MRLVYSYQAFQLQIRQPQAPQIRGPRHQDPNSLVVKGQAIRPT